MTVYNSILEFANNQCADIKQYGDEIVFKYCPYCHGGNRTDIRSFFINTTTGQFNCFRASCNKSGNLFTLAKDFDCTIPENYNPEKLKKQYRVPEQKIEQPNASAYKYFGNRGISKKIVDKYKITTQKDHDNILEIPFIDENGKVISIKCRKTDFVKSRDRNKEWNKERGYKNILFGMYQCDTSKDTLIVTEGQIDCLSIAECGFNNVVSVPNGASGFSWYRDCKKWLSQFRKLLVFGDYEKEQITLVDNFKELFNGIILTVKPEDYKDCKDANEILYRYGKDTLKHAIENAQITFKNDCIVSLSDIEPEEYNESDYIKTGIRELDYMLGGGLYKGEVICLTGNCGEGKTTFASQIVANMIDNGTKVLAYSGELQPKTYQKWLNLQLSGRENIVVNSEGIDFKNYIKKPVEKTIIKWYKNKVYLIDSIKNDLKDKPENLLDLVRTAIIQCDIDFVLIDNLMTAMQGNYGNDLYAEQSKFVGELCKMAMEYKVAIMLVAHPRKNGNNTNDDISGSGDIANKSAIILHYGKPKNNNFSAEYHKYKNIRLLTVSKNRHNGKVTEDKKDIVLAFENESKRIEEIKISAFDFHSAENIGTDKTTSPENYKKVTDQKELSEMFKRQYKWKSEV